MKKRFVVYAAFAFILSCVVGLLQAPAFADEYPSKPITMIVAYSAGGGSDLAARTVAKYTEKISWAADSCGKPPWSRRANGVHGA